MYAKSAPIATRGQDRAARRDRPRQRERAVEELADLADERERRQHPRVAAGAGRDEDQSVDAGVERLLRVTDADDVVEDDAAVRMDRVEHRPVRRAQARDHDRHAMLDAYLDVVHQPIVRRVDDLVDRVRRDRPIRMRGPMRRERVLDPTQPARQLVRRSRVERGERADDAGLALRDDELGAARDEHRGADDRQAQVTQDFGNGHGDLGFRRPHESKRSWRTNGTVIMQGPSERRR